jgi:hypothetical protein
VNIDTCFMFPQTDGLREFAFARCTLKGDNFIYKNLFTKVSIMYHMIYNKNKHS